MRVCSRGIIGAVTGKRQRPLPSRKRDSCPPEWQLLDPVSRQLQPLFYGNNSTTSIQTGIPVAGVDIYYVGMWTNLICYEEDDDVLGNIDYALDTLVGHEKQQIAHIFTLPTELLWKVFNDLEADDIVVVSTTCLMMFKLVSTIIAKDVRQTSGFRAHQPLATVEANMNPLPEALLQDEMASQSIFHLDFLQLAFSDSWLPHTLNSQDSRDYRRAIQMVYERIQPYKSTSRSHSHYIELNRIVPTWGPSSRTLSRTPRRHTNPSHRLLHHLLSRENQSCAFDDPSNGTLYYLRNHTTHDLVRVCNCPEPHISSHSEECSDTKSDYVLISPKLDDIFVMMTRHYSRRIYFELATQRGAWTTGPWSGHRFDIVSAKRHAREYPSSASPVQRSPPTSSTPELPDKSASPPTTATHWRDVTSAVVTRACWEHDYIRGRDRILSLGNPEDLDQVRKRRPSKRAIAGSWNLIKLWLPYMDSVYPGVAALLENGGHDQDGTDMIEAWRRKLDEIIERWEGKWRPKREERLSTKTCLAGDDWGDAEKRQRVDGHRRSERLMGKQDVSG